MSEDDTFTDRDEAIENAKYQASFLDFAIGAEISVCLGPPKCLLDSDEACEHAEAGCPLCDRLQLQPDGTWKQFKKAAN